MTEKIIKTLLLLLILFIGASFGAYYTDNNWKHDLRNFAHDNNYFRFDETGKYYTIQEYDINNYLNLSSTNYTLNFTSRKKTFYYTNTHILIR